VNIRHTKHVEKFVLNTGLPNSNRGGARASGTICCTAACHKFSHREHPAKTYMRNAASCEFISSWQQRIIAGHAQTCPSTLATYSATLAKVRGKTYKNLYS